MDGCDDDKVNTLPAATQPPTSKEWEDLLAIPTTPVSELARGKLPDAPGVYLWRHDNQVCYVGMATSLRGRVWGKHLGAGVSLSGSSLRRNVCECLFGIPPNVTGRPTRRKVTPEQAGAIRNWLLTCDLSWQTCASVHDADQLERQLLHGYRPSLNRR